MKTQIVNTSDGSKTLYLPEMDEQYHSLNGAITESEHVFIKSGFNFHQSHNPVVFEVGFGTGLNCLLTAINAHQYKRKTTYLSIEKYPLEKDIILQLNYGKMIQEESSALFEKIHSCPWNQEVQLSPYFTLKKLQDDFKTIDFKQFAKCDVIYFDAFGPDKQPEMWKPEMLRRIYSITNKNGVFVTYSAKGQIRRDLMSCGYEMERIPGPPGKKQMMRGIKRN